MPKGDPATWMYLADIPTPPEVTAHVDAYCRRYWVWRKRVRQAVEQEEKILHLFPGNQIAAKHTPKGLLLLFVAPPFAPELNAWLDSLPREERIQIQIWYSPDWDENTSFL